MAFTRSLPWVKSSFVKLPTEAFRREPYSGNQEYTVTFAGDDAVNQRQGTVVGVLHRVDHRRAEASCDITCALECVVLISFCRERSPIASGSHSTPREPHVHLRRHDKEQPVRLNILSNARSLSLAFVGEGRIVGRGRSNR